MSAIALCASSCATQDPWTVPSAPEAPLADGPDSPADPIAYETMVANGVPYDVVRVLDPSHVALYWERPDGERFGNFLRLREWLRSQGRALVFATNGGIYGRDGAPLGLHVEHGLELVPLNLGPGGGGNFYLKPNGVFFVEDGQAAIRESYRFQSENRGPDLALQSGPLLVQGNAIHPSFGQNSESVYIRNGIGVREDGAVVFAISRRAINLYAFASLFRDSLDCPDALYLDGRLSGMYAPALGREDVGIRYAAILAITAPSAAAPTKSDTTPK